MGRYFFRRSLFAALLAAILLLPTAAGAAWITHVNTTGGADVNYFRNYYESSITRNYEQRFSYLTPWFHTSSELIQDIQTTYGPVNQSSTGEFTMTINGSTGWTAYCAAFGPQITQGAYTIVSIDQAALEYQKAAWAMDHYAPGIAGSGSNDAVTIAALQAAIWTLTTDNGYDTEFVNGDYQYIDAFNRYYDRYKTVTNYGWWVDMTSDPAVRALYFAILDDVNANFSLAGITGLYAFAGGLTKGTQNLVVGKISPYRTLPPSGTPEPASMLLLGSGLAGLAALRRRRRS